jgi:nucleotide-binding universal stress UspA family protein
MLQHRIVVGLDGSAGARDALCWAVRLAAQQSSTVLAVTAWPDADRAGSRERDALRHDLLALEHMQRTLIAAATALLTHPPRVIRELVLADAVTALYHAAVLADLVVLGTGRSTGLPPGGVAARLAARKSRGRPVPVVVVATAAQVVVPPPVAAPPPADRPGHSIAA